MKYFMIPLYLFVTSTFLLFSTFEMFPDLLHLMNIQNIPYYFVKSELKEDSSLVFTPLFREKTIELDNFRGDMYSPSFGIEVPAIRYRASYDRNGFRKNSSIPPVEILVIGDSFVEIGESDELTFSEILKRASHLSTWNLGRGWYGPQQYLEMLKRYGLSTNAKYAIFCFFDGNDMEDVRQYTEWQKGGGYYHFAFSRKNFVERYFLVLHQIYSAFRSWGRENLTSHLIPHPELAMIRLKDHDIPMTFDNWNVAYTSESLLGTQEWKTLAAVLGEFRELALENRMTPIILFIPSKAEVYGSFFTDKSGDHFLSMIDTQLRFETNSMDALMRVSQGLNIRFVNLLPYFKRLAETGALLYYPFDTHWNIAGRQAAADFVTEAISQK